MGLRHGIGPRARHDAGREVDHARLTTRLPTTHLQQAMTKTRPINLHSKFELVRDLWSPHVVAEMNDYQFKIARVRGKFVWHAHPDTDEAFFIIEGHLRIDLPDGSVELGPGELFVVPRGVRHRPVAQEEVKLLLVEPRGVVNTGDVGGERTVENERWI